MARHLTQLGITRQVRLRDDEFRIDLSKLTRGQVGNLEMARLHFSYAISFGSFLSILRDRTASQSVKGGLTVQEGPWKYKVEEDGRAVGDWYDLMDENSFEDMLRKLKLSEGAATMMHVSTPSMKITVTAVPFMMFWT